MPSFVPPQLSLENMKTFFTTLLTVSHLAAVAGADSPTNFVVLFMDDNGWGDSSVNMGVQAVHETPHIQKMADQGIGMIPLYSLLYNNVPSQELRRSLLCKPCWRITSFLIFGLGGSSLGITFSDFHSSFSVCTASRGALLTGRLAPRTGVANNFGPDSSFGMARGELTIADVLGNHGYDSHMIVRLFSKIKNWVIASSRLNRSILLTYHIFFNDVLWFLLRVM